MTGVQGTGLYGQLRMLTDQRRLDSDHLRNAPLGPRQKKKLEKTIESLNAEIRRVRTLIREDKKKRTTQGGLP